ncbi:hypothetical protein NKH53_24425 [Mesorhizobium australicum]|uniref:hypothetical protein n=1 Tax=Mesorhizobium australicum TaxID=536018 RepID=UPI00333DE243
MVLDVKPEQVTKDHSDVVAIGSGIGSAFVLHEFARRRKARILLLEWGRHNTPEWQLDQNFNTDIDDETTSRSSPNDPIRFTGRQPCTNPFATLDPPKTA